VLSLMPLPFTCYVDVRVCACACVRAWSKMDEAKAALVSAKLQQSPDDVDASSTNGVQCVAVCCSVLQRVAACCNVYQVGRVVC